MRNDRVGRRALALLQLGAATAAERELFAASIDADPRFIEAILAVAQKASLPSLSAKVGNANWDQRHNIKGFDGAVYPLPPWQPAGGYSVDRALLWGFMRQESAFNPKARSYVGAMGLMQLMPGTARLVVRNTSPDQMGANFYDPSTNIALGQAYIGSLLGEVDNNLVRTAAGYNGGPGNVMRWDNSLNASQDPLALRGLDPAQRDARLRAAGAGQLLDVPDPARPADAVARPDRRPRMAALHAAGQRALTLPAM